MTTTSLVVLGVVFAAGYLSHLVQFLVARAVSRLRNDTRDYFTHYAAAIKGRVA